MNKIERVAAVLEGRQPDRPPVSFWYHFASDAASGPKAVEAHVRHVEQYDLDFLKIMDDNRYPRTAAAQPAVIHSPSDLDKLTVLGGDEDAFSRQLELIDRLARRYRGSIRLATTVFNSWTTLRTWTAPETSVHGPPKLGAADARDAALTRLLHEAPAAFARALDVLAESLANFARHALAAGADGIFLSVRDDWVDTAENPPGSYDRLVRPGDLRILEAASAGSFNMLHVCGRATDFKRFGGYPVHVINWADRYAGPAIRDVVSWLAPAICGGLDNLATMSTGSADDCAREVADSLRQAGGRPILIAPGCTFDRALAPETNLKAIRRAVES